MPDSFALVLLAWFVVCAWFSRHHRLRLEAMLIMIGGWVGSVSAQYWLVNLAPVSQFVVIDMLIVTLMFSLVAHRASRWIGIVIACHGIMLVGHAIHHFSGWPAAWMYVSCLNLLGYISAGAIAGGPMVGAIKEAARAYHARHAHFSWGVLRHHIDTRRHPSHTGQSE